MTSRKDYEAAKGRVRRFMEGEMVWRAYKMVPHLRADLNLIAEYEGQSETPMTTTPQDAELIERARVWLSGDSSGPDNQYAIMRALADRLEAMSQGLTAHQAKPVVWRGVRYVAAIPTQEQRDAVCLTDLPKQGDAILVWINEGDLYMTAPASPTVEER